MVAQYNLDAGVHFKEGEEGQVDLRITTLEDMLQDENRETWSILRLGII